MSISTSERLLPADFDDSNPAQDASNAKRLSLADEWHAQSPRKAHEIERFYRDATQLRGDLDAWHALPERQAITEAIVWVARHVEARSVLDIGCGAGHDLKALRLAGIPVTVGVEPNIDLRLGLEDDGYTVYHDITDVTVAQADLILCLDVLEHLPDPEAFITNFASRARIGAYLIEMTATHDVGTPLHLESNRGWQPGRALERCGWTLNDKRDRLRVWKRVSETVTPRASLILCAYRSVSVPTMDSALQLAQHGWRIITKAGDALISRSRSQVLSHWWSETADDVALFVDDDIQFHPRVAEALVAQCRNGHDVICAAYPVRNGQHLALRTLHAGVIPFGPNTDPMEIEYPATGFMAVHRKVLDAMIPTLPLCHPGETWNFWPMFDPFVSPNPRTGLLEYLSEDWAFGARARDLGFKVWLDPSLRISHLAQVELHVANMAAIHSALGG